MCLLVLVLGGGGGLNAILQMSDFIHALAFERLEHSLVFFVCFFCSDLVTVSPVDT